MSAVETVKQAVYDAIEDVLALDDMSRITNESEFSESPLDADSLDLAEIGMKIERKLDIGIPDDKMEGIETVGALIAVVESIYIKPDVNTTKEA